jgi:nucleoside-diphosphate-sugar epimerase
MLMKRAFVTGASGFIGAAVVRRLLASKVSVAVLQRQAEVGRRLMPVRDQLQFLPATPGSDLPETESLREWAPDTIFHLGWAGVESAQRNDAAVQLRNVQFAAEFAQQCVTAKVLHFIGAGSQAEYGSRPHEILESDCPAPTTLYGAAKLSACFLTQRICELGGVSHTWLRIFSTYGPGDNPDWMIPSLIRQLRSGDRPKLTAAEQMWDYLHVEDAAAGFVAVGERQSRGIFNLASGKAIPLRTVIEQLRNAVNPDAELGFGELPYRPDQVMRLQGNIDRLTAATGWHPTVPLRDGLRELVAQTSETDSFNGR